MRWLPVDAAGGSIFCAKLARGAFLAVLPIQPPKMILGSWAHLPPGSRVRLVKRSYGPRSPPQPKTTPFVPGPHAPPHPLYHRAMMDPEACRGTRPAPCFPCGVYRSWTKRTLGPGPSVGRERDSP